MNNINGEVSCVNLCETKKIIKNHNERDNGICLEKKNYTYILPVGDYRFTDTKPIEKFRCFH
jgi:hypothetical protein